MGKLGIKIGKKPTIKKPSVPVLKEVCTGEEQKPMISTPTGTRRREKQNEARYEPTDWDDSLPYGGKVYLARRKRPDTWLCIFIQFCVLAFAFGMVYYAYYHTDHMHFHITKVYANLGHTEAQATVGHKLLHGKGVVANRTAAMEWFDLAAKQGHPQSAYNLAVGHLQGHKTNLQPGDAHQLIKDAAAKGVPEAVEVLEKVCSRGHCDM